MRKFFLLLLLMLAVTPVFAQAAGHSVVLTWNAPSDAIASSTYNIYKGAGLCSTNPTMVQVNTTPIAALTYTDPEPVGAYCYSATQAQNGAESAQEVPIVVKVVPNAPSGLAGKGQ
jgi:hypothetical protein